VEPSLRTSLNEQATLIQDALDVANIQDDIIKAVKEDSRMADFRRNEFLKELDGKILPLSTVGYFLSVLTASFLINMPIR
jgi:uncharacterized protein YjfI (DUF2170 family)